ncbi:Abhydrolase domain-containing protein [Ceratobasidium sp. AG-Ba]|nr:Abhydrolase domain-containing protein [Ceratobasidium sp. AG-Ba]
MHPTIPALLTLSALVAANPRSLPTDFHRYAPRQAGIQWQPCTKDGTSTVECGRFEVPLDYANEAAGKASLLVARYPATKEPKLGTLFLNPGGPGGSGVEFVVGGDVIMNTVGGQYDLVSWDPRGVGYSVPLAECFATGTEENAFWEGTIPRAGLEARGNFTDPGDLEAFYAQEPEVDHLLIELGKKCVEYSPNTFQYVGSAAAVRDMVALHDLLEGADKPLNYWGFSYGTIIGIYFVNMFPSRVGRVVLDGVVDPVYWANRPADDIWSINAESTDEALTGFVSACAAAGPTGCAIASEGSTADSLREGLRELIDKAYDYKKAAGASAQFGSAQMRSVLFQGMYSPTKWPKLAEDILAYWNFLTNNGTTTKRSLPLPEKRQTTDKAPVYSIQAITCADAMDAGNTTTKDVFDELVRVTRDVSQMFGPSWGIAGFYCHRWPVRAVERYTGPWNNKLANPILVIGNEADPITPFRSAKSVADALGDSAILVEQDDYGHVSLAMHSDCTFKILENYFLNNALPSTDQFCGTNQQLFPGPGVTKSSLAALSSSNSNSSTSDLQTQLEEEQTRARQLFIAVIALASATGLLLLSLIASCVFGKKGGKSKKDVVYWGKEDDSGEGHTYKTPYDGATSLKLGGGYAPVKT